MNNHSLGILFSVTTAVLWGILAVALKVALNFTDSATIIWFRFTFSFLALFLFFLVTNPRELLILVRPPFLAVLAMLSLAFNYFGYMKGIELTYASNAQIIIQGGPLMLILLGVFVLRERVNRKQVAGFALVLGGFYLFYSDQLRHLVTSAHFYNLGNLWVFAAAVTWAIYAFIQKKLVKTMTPQKLNLLIYGYSALIFFPMSTPRQLLQFNSVQWPQMIFLGANTLVAYGLLSEALKKIPANQVSIIITCNPVLTIILMTVLNALEVSWAPKEIIGAAGYIGAAVVIVGAIMVIRFASGTKKS